MKKILFAVPLIALVVGCGEHKIDEPRLMANTEEYFKAHGIISGQPNELRIGGTLFRFPAGVGLNPSTSTSEVKSVDGSPMTLSSKEGLAQGKYMIVSTPIMKGHADNVTFKLDPERGYIPRESPFKSGVMVTISKRMVKKWDGVNANPDETLKEIKGRKVKDHPTLGLREYVAPKEWLSPVFESLKIDAESGSKNGQFFSCQPHMKGLCDRIYWVPDGSYQVEINMPAQFFLNHWQQALPAIYSFIDSVAVNN